MKTDSQQKARLLELEVKLDSLTNPINSEYWYVSDRGTVERDPWQKADEDVFRRSSGNFFKSKKEAEANLRCNTIENSIKRRAKELNLGKVFLGPRGYSIAMSNRDNLFPYLISDLTLPCLITLFDLDTARQIIVEFNEDLIFYFTTMRGIL